VSYSKLCKYECGTEIFWDKAENRFKETLSKEYHTQDRCKAFKSGQLTMQQNPQQEYNTYGRPKHSTEAKPDTITLQMLSHQLSAINEKTSSIEDKVDYYTQILAKIFEKYPDAKTLSDLRTQNAQLMQVIKEKGINFEKASEYKPDPEKVEERITEYKEIEGAANGTSGNED